MKPQQIAACCTILLLSLFLSSNAKAEPPAPTGEIPRLPLLLPEGPSTAPELARRRTDLGNLGYLSTSALAQTLPRIAAAAARKQPLEYNHIIIRHVYVGGIANLFRGGSTITSQQFVSPSSGQNGRGGFGGNSGGIGGGSSGGFGGGIGGGRSGGFGGGFGGSSGGFGGGGGFGGNSGGGIGGFR